MVQLIFILWMTAGVWLLFLNQDILFKVSIPRMLMATLILLMSAPILLVAALVEILLAMLMPEAEDENDDFEGS
jgi:hypothetical protein